ncbi:MAG TPA: PAS domain S-box protein [Terriglobales bacterium]|nr:PAS domain S-box protein [Terriglobales bacterium]
MGISTRSEYVTSAAGTGQRSMHALMLVILRGWCASAAALSILVGAIVLIGGWALGIAWLRGGALVTMKANTALCLILCGVALWRSRPARAVHSPDGIATALAGSAALISALTLGEDLARWNLGIDQAIFREGAAQTTALHPGRMSPFTAVCIAALGFAIVALDRPRLFRLGQRLAVAAGFVAFLNVLAYAYGVRVAEHVDVLGPYTEMTIHTAITLVILSIGVTAARPGTGATGIFAQDTLGGEAARILWPAAVIGPFAIGAIRLAGQRAGYYGTEFGLALMASGNIVLFSILSWWTSVRFHRTDARRRRAEAELRLVNTQLEERVRRRTIGLAASEARYRQLIEDSAEGFVVHQSGRIMFANAATARILGYGSPNELLGLEARALIAPEFRDEVRERVAARLRGEGVAAVVDVEALKKDGTRVWVQGVSSVIEWEGTQSTLVAFLDISERRRLEAAERHAAALQRVTQLANAAAHEINNPLTIISGNLQCLEAELPGQPEVRGRIERCKTAILRITGIVDHMQRITRFELLEIAGRVPTLDLRRSSTNVVESDHVHHRPHAERERTT